MTHKPTAEQSAIIEAASSKPESLMISAYAGTGKTSTLEMLASAVDTPTALAVAFNTRIVKELKSRFPSNFDMKTLNGLGHQAWGRTIGRRPAVNERKLGKIITETLKELGFESSMEDWDTIRRVVSRAMNSGLVPDHFKLYADNTLVSDDPGTWSDMLLDEALDANPALAGIARECLIRSVKASFAGTISFDDQIYMSALYGGKFEKYPLVLVDEAQDLSPINREQIRRCALDRIIIVGDQRQSIYAFRGADHHSMARLRKLRSAWLDLPLTTTFRCPKVIVRKSQDHAPGFNAFEFNPEGEILQMDDWSWKEIDDIAENRPIAVICRNNAPLLSLAFKLIRQGVPVAMLGRDIGKNLTALSKKIIKDDSTSAEKCAILIGDWESTQKSLALANDKPNQIEGIEDRAECLRAVLEAEGVTDAGSLRQRLGELFAREQARVILTSGHRAKGLEWPIVVHLDPWRIPSKYAKRNPDQMEQEKNLLYVIDTRTKLYQIQASMEGFQES